MGYNITNILFSQGVCSGLSVIGYRLSVKSRDAEIPPTEKWNASFGIGKITI